jgi:hypothetical protein
MKSQREAIDHWNCVAAFVRELRRTSVLGADTKRQLREVPRNVLRFLRGLGWAFHLGI